MEKLYVVVRNDLAPGLQIAQACHVVREFAEEWKRLEREWYLQSKNVAILQVPGEEELRALYDRADALGVACSSFQEPDLDNAMTAIALGGDGAQRLTSSLPLALRQLTPVRLAG